LTSKTLTKTQLRTTSKFNLKFRQEPDPLATDPATENADAGDPIASPEETEPAAEPAAAPAEREKPVFKHEDSDI